MNDLEIILFKEKVKERASNEKTPSQSIYNGESFKCLLKRNFRSGVFVNNA
jgi:hypothetical protein